MYRKLFSCFITEVVTTALNLVKSLLSSGACDARVSNAIFQLSLELFMIASVYGGVERLNFNGMFLRFMDSEPDHDKFNWRRISFVTFVVSIISIGTSSCLWLPFIQNLDERCTFLANVLLNFGMKRESMLVQVLIRSGVEIFQYGMPIGMFVIATKNLWEKLGKEQTIVVEGSHVFIMRPITSEDGDERFSEVSNVTQRAIEG